MKELVAAGVSEAQAEVHARVLGEMVIERLATKEDLTLLKQELRSEIREVELRLNQRLAELENRLTIRMGVLLAAGIGIVATLVKLL